MAGRSVLETEAAETPALVLAISHSGASPDLCAAAENAKAAGAFTLGLINRGESALGRAVEARIETGAGNERAVAATKSFILTVTALRVRS